ncbi:MAG: hypothetical protein L3K10_01910 [Thermoplasmata archaeon]|nr:hypothetical protein [Thermoplasmata archaeon]
MSGSSGLVCSLPLFLLGAVFFVSGIAVRFDYPTYGPGAFTLWALLLALGFISTIGAVASWTLAGDPVPAPREATSAPVVPAYLPIEFPESTPSPNLDTAGRTRADFGRPTPEVRAARLEGEWYEGPTETERFAGRPAREPTGVEALEDLSSTPEVGSEPVEKVLADLEGIEKDLAPRARPVDVATA